MTYNTGNSAWYNNPRKLSGGSRQPLLQSIYLQSIHLDPQSSSKCSYSMPGTRRPIYSAKLRRTDHGTCSCPPWAFDIPSSLLLRSRNQHSILPVANRMKLEERMLRRGDLWAHRQSRGVREFLNPGRTEGYICGVRTDRPMRLEQGWIRSARGLLCLRGGSRVWPAEICGVRYRKLRWRRRHPRRLW